MATSKRVDHSLGVYKLIRASPLLLSPSQGTLQALLGLFHLPPPAGPQRFTLLARVSTKRLITIFIFFPPRGSEWHIPNRLRPTRLLEFHSSNEWKEAPIYKRGGESKGGSFQLPKPLILSCNKCPVNLLFSGWLVGLQLSLCQAGLSLHWFYKHTLRVVFRFDQES